MWPPRERADPDAQVTIELPDDLAEQVKARELPVASICQRALRAEISHLQTIEHAVGSSSRPVSPEWTLASGPVARRARH